MNSILFNIMLHPFFSFVNKNRSTQIDKNPAYVLPARFLSKKVKKGPSPFYQFIQISKDTIIPVMSAASAANKIPLVFFIFIQLV